MMDASNEIVMESGGLDPAIIIALIFGVIILGGFLWGLYMMRKQKIAQNGIEVGDEIKVSRDVSRNGIESVNGNCLLQDTRWLIRKVERIEDGIVVTDGGRRFIAAITCRGIDFYNAGVSEQLAVMRGYQKFYNIVENRMSYRQYCKPIDIDIPKERYASKYAETMVEYDNYLNLFQTSKEKQVPEEELQRLAMQVNRYEKRLLHMEEQMKRMEFYSGSDVVMDVTQDYIFDWTYTPGIADVKLNESEIFLRAKSELKSIARQKIDALMATGVKGRMCTQDEMEDMFRRHSKPIGAELYKQKMLRTSSYDEDIVTSDSLEEAANALYEEDIRKMQESLFGNTEEV